MAQRIQKTPRGSSRESRWDEELGQNGLEPFNPTPSRQASKQAGRQISSIDDALAQNEDATRAPQTPSSVDDLRGAEENPEGGTPENKKGGGIASAALGAAGAGWVTSVGGIASGQQTVIGAAKKNTKKWIIGAAAGGLITSVLAVLTVLPEKLDIIMEQMEHKFYARVESYVEKRTSKMLETYLNKYVFRNTKGIKACVDANVASFVVTADCFHRENSEDFPKTKLGQMYKTWWDSKIEGSMGGQITYDPKAKLSNGKVGPTWKMVFPDGEVDVDPDDPGKGLDEIFHEGGRRTGYQTIMRAIKDKTDSNFISRMFISDVLVKKDGLVKCMFFCSLKDKIDTKKVDIKLAWRGFLTDRVVGGVFPRASLFMACMFEGGKSCTEDNPDFQEKYGEKIDALKEEHDADSIDSILEKAQKYGAFREKGGNFTKFIIDFILEKIGSKLEGVVGSSVINAIPIVGQIIYGVIVGYQALSIVLQISNIFTWVESPAAQYASTVIKAASYTGAYQALRLATDEARAAQSNNVYDIQIKGAQTQSLDGMNQSFLWNSQFGNPQGFANFGDMFDKAAYAQSADPKTQYPYVCDSDGTHPDSNQTLCPNWKFNTPNPLKSFVKSLPAGAVAEAAANSQAVQDVQSVGNDIVNTIDTPTNWLSGQAYAALPDSVKTWLEKNLGDISKKIAEYLFAPPFDNDTDIQGAKLYDASYLGVDWAVNDTLRGGVDSSGHQTGYGARVGTPAEVSAQDKQIQKEDDAQFAALSPIDKIFSTDYTQSVVSQLALAIPSDPGQLLSAISPSTFANLFGDIISPPAKALDINADPGGIPQYILGSELDDVPVRDPSDTSQCPNDRVGANGQLKSLSDPGTTDMGLGRAEFTTSNVCVLDDQIASAENSSALDDVPLDSGSPDASFQQAYLDGMYESPFTPANTNAPGVHQAMAAKPAAPKTPLTSQFTYAALMPTSTILQRTNNATAAL